MELKKQKYELSVWEHILKPAGEGYSNEYYDEQLLCIIGGSDFSDSPFKATNVIFTENTNAANTLSFDIYKKYADEEEGEFKENPFFRYLQNEAHLKLKYDNKWYDFVIKEVTESDSEYSYKVSATDYFVNELSKNGNNLEFSTELANNMDTVENLGKVIVDGTDWEIKPSDALRQRIEEPLYWVSLKSDINAYNALTHQPLSSSIPSEAHIYVFYSVINNKNPYFQFLYKTDAIQESDYEVDDNGVIINSEKISCYIDGVTYENDGWPSFLNPVTSISKTHRGERLVRNALSTYDKYTGQVVNIYDKNGTEYYCYTDSEYIAKGYNVVSNGILNDTNFTNDGNWTPVPIVANTMPTVDTFVYPDLDTWLKGHSNPGDMVRWTERVGNYLKINLNNDANYLMNDGISAQPELFFEEDKLHDREYKDIPRGTNFTLRYQIYDNIESRTGTSNIGVKFAKYTINDDGSYTIKDEDVYVDINSVKEEFVKTQDTAQLHNKIYYNSAYQPIDEWSSPDGVYEKFYKGSADTLKNIKYEDAKHLGIFIYSTKPNQLEYYIENIQFFKTTIFKEQNIYPNYVPEGLNDTLVHYYFYRPGSTEIIEQTTEGDFTLKYDDNYNKIRSIEKDSTNRFDLIQTLNEAFECWSKIVIGRNKETGKINVVDTYVLTKDITPVNGKTYYDENHNKINNPQESNFYKNTTGTYSAALQYFRLINGQYCPVNITEKEFKDFVDKQIKLYLKKDIYEKRHRLDKEIVFSEYIGEQRYVGLHYGLNTNGIERTIDSNEIITKLIVPANENEFGTNGTCTIARATENSIKANFIINFDYYYNTGLLDKTIVEPKLNNPGGYLYEYSQINKKIIELEDILSKKETAFYDIDAEYTVAQETVTASAKLINELKSDLLKFTNGLTYEQLPGTDEKGALQEWADFFAGKDEDEIKSRLEDIANQQGMLNKANKTLANSPYTSAKDEIEQTRAQINRYTEQLKALDADFFKEYSQFIQEGTWSADEYYDDNLYYYDALTSLYVSKSPKVSYNINVVDLSGIEDYDIFKFNIGDRTFIEDREIFGNAREEIVIIEMSHNLDDPSQNTITVQNYKTEFADLFQRFAAATTQIEFHGGSYERAANVINSDGTIDSGYLNSTLGNGNIQIGSKKNSLAFVDSSLISWNATSGETAKIIGGRLLLSDDGGNTWSTEISGKGINANNIYAGQLNSDNVIIGPSNKPSFRWDNTGINAFTYDNNNSTDYTKFVRFDEFGLYGVNGNTFFKPANVQDILNEANFGFVWDNFFLRTKPKRPDGTIIENAQVKISSDNDIEVKIGEIDRVKIGYLTTNSKDEDVFGLRIKNNEGKSTVETGSDGNITITGTINATAGEIAGFNIKPATSTYPSYLYADDNNTRVLISPREISLGSQNTPEFRVDNNGNLTAENANIMGKLTTAVFEKNTTRVIGGVSLFKNAENIDLLKTLQGAQSAEVQTIYLNTFDNSKISSIFNAGDKISIIASINKRTETGVEGTENYYVIHSINDVDNSIILETSITLNSENKYLVIQLDDNTIDGNIKDWVIGINSTAQRRAFNLMPNSITFNDIKFDESTHEVKLSPRVVLGDLSQLPISEIDIKNGLYATNAYLTGSFYANRDGDNRISFTNEGFNLGNILSYDTSTNDFEIKNGKDIIGLYNSKSDLVELKNGNTWTTSSSGLQWKDNTLSIRGQVYIGSGDKTINDLNNDVEDIEAQKMYRLEVTSTEGNIFKQGTVDTYLEVQIFSWDDNITSSIPDTSIIWTRSSDNVAADTIWNNQHKTGKRLKITSEDVSHKATFNCELISSNN